MKKAIVCILTLILCLCAMSAWAEANEVLFARLEGVEWSFSSGAGGWSTEMRILPDGAFSGEYHDSEMGEMAEEYPNGTVYCCSFTGKLSVTEAKDDGPWQIRVDEVKRDESQAAESIDDGTRFVLAEPYGVVAGDVMTLYAPGTPLTEFSEEMRMWAHLLGEEGDISQTDFWFLYSEANDTGFVGYPPEEVVGLANPWEDMTAEQLQAVSGVTFSVPEEAEKVIYRWLASEKLAELQFTWNSDEFCARAQAAQLSEGELKEISGMYFAWEHEEDVTIAGCPGTIGIAQADSADWAERYLWYDAASGTMYSLSVSTVDPDGLDLTAVAEQVVSQPDAEN